MSGGTHGAATLVSASEVVPGTAGRKGHRLRLTAGRVGVLVALAALWQLASTLNEFVPSFVATIRELGGAFGEGWIFPHLQITGTAVLVGFMVAALAGIPAGLALGGRGVFAVAFLPVVAAAFVVPRIVLYPIILQVFGVGVSAEAALAAISAFFPVALTVAAGTANVNPTLTKLGRSFGLSVRQRYQKLVFPAISPSLMLAMRIGFSIAFIQAVIAEFFAAIGGLGWLVARAYALLELPRMYSGMLIILLIAVGGNMLLWAVERRIKIAVGS